MILKKILNPLPTLQSANQPPAFDRLFHALADPARRQMVERLSRGPASVSELAKPFAMSLPAVVQHIQVLEASGLVSSEKVGRVRTCRLDGETLSVAEQWLAARRAGCERRLAGFADDGNREKGTQGLLDALGEELHRNP